MADQDTKTAAAAAAPKTKQVRVRSKVGPMIHLYTGAEVDEIDRKMNLDDFVQIQLDAGKWEVVAD